MKTKIIRNKLVTGLRNYCQKNGFTDVLLGLSGGLDSAVVLALACEAVGCKNVHTIMMKTKYTSQISIDLADEAARQNNVNHCVLDIQPSVDSFLNTVDFIPKNPVTPQNIQARVRGVLAMAYSNENGWLLLACGNKSEAAMGYCTLYGDVCGGISPIGDIFKTEVYQLANLYNSEGKFFVPQGIIDRPPTAELALDQKDTDSLPPYSVLDEILRNYIYGNKPIPATQQEGVRKIRNQFDKMAFKRLQMPPVINVRD